MVVETLSKLPVVVYYLVSIGAVAWMCFLRYRYRPEAATGRESISRLAVAIGAFACLMILMVSLTQVMSVGVHAGGMKAVGGLAFAIVIAGVYALLLLHMDSSLEDYADD